jgi:hypothetical protein
VDQAGVADATQVSDNLPVIVNETGAHFLYDADKLADDDGAGLHLGDFDTVVVGRTVHIELETDQLPVVAAGENLYWYFTGNVTDTPTTNNGRSYASLTRTSGEKTRLLMFEAATADLDGWMFCFADVPNEQLRGPILLSFSLAVTKLAGQDMYNVDMAIFLNGTRIANYVRHNDFYYHDAGYLSLGRWLPCRNEGSGCVPFYGTIRSVAIDTQPLDYLADSYEVTDSCMVTLEQEEMMTTTTTVAATTTTVAASSTTTSLVLTGGDLDGGAAAGLGSEEDTGNQDKSLPLTIIMVLCGIAIVCCLALGGLLVVRSRQRQRVKVGRSSGSQQKSSPRGEQPLARSRSSKRRRGGDGNYAKVAVAKPAGGTSDYSAMPGPSSDTDYSTMPTAVPTDVSESGYRSMPSVEGGDEYRTMPAADGEGDDDYGTMPASRTHAYGTLDSAGSTGTYSELHREKVVSPRHESYASGDLAV